MWLEMFSKQVVEGNPYPRWLPGTYAGFGSPTFYFYPPLTYFLGAAFSAVGIASSGIALFNAVQIAAGVLALWTSFLLLNRLGATGLRSIAGALLYAFSPYAFIDLFARSTLSEYLALAWIPLVFLGLIKILSGERQGWTLSTVGWSLLILTSIPAACCVIIGWLAMLLLSSDITAKKAAIAFTSLTMAAGSCAIYLLPAVGLASWIQPDRYVTHYEVNVLRAWFTGSKMGFSMLIGVSVILIVAAYLVVRSRGRARQSLPWAVLLVIAILSQLPYISDWLYHSVQPFIVIRYPFRFTMIAMLGLAVILTSSKELYPTLILLIAFVSLALYATYGIAHVWNSETPATLSDLRDAPEYVNKCVTRGDSELIAFTTDNQYGPLVSSKEEIGVVRAALAMEGTTLEDNLTITKQGWITIHQFYWPTWRATFRGQPVQLKADEDGLLSALLPAGDGRFEVHIERSNLERTAALVSLASLIVFALAQIILLINARKQRA